QTPASVQSGQAVDEVQKLTVSATGGTFLLYMEHLPYAFASYDASDQELREALEGGYGPGTVEVSGGPGDETGDKPYEIKFVGNRADQGVPLIEASGGNFG